MPTNLPDVSVILPIYNAEPFLDQCLRSIEDQTHSALEIICVNDGSTDDSLRIIETHASNDARIIVIDKHNEGYGASCNRGIDLARGTYVAIVEPDDWVEPSMIQDMLSFAATFDAPIDIIKTPYWRILMPDTPQQIKLNCSYHNRIKPATQPFTIDQAAHLLRHHPSIWSALYRKAFLDDTGIRFKEIPGAGWADNPFLMETLCQAQTIVYANTPYYCYREDLPGSSSTLKTPTLPFNRWNDMMDVLEKLGITDQTILRAHISRGFTYLGGILEEHDVSDPLIQTEMTKMFSRMDSTLVLDETEISPGMKELFIQTRGLPPQKIMKMPYLKSLIQEFGYGFTNNGPQFAFSQISHYLKTHKSRQGK